MKSWLRFITQLSLLALAQETLAAPLGGQVTAGSALIEQQGSQTTIQQQSSSAVIDWRSYNLESSESVLYQVPNQGVTLNRITGGPSYINGVIESNGSLFFVNQSGMVFGQQATISADKVLLTSGQIDNDDFMAGHYQFTQAQASLINEGKIKGQTWVSLIAPKVINRGDISAEGSVRLTSAENYTLNYDDGSLIGFSLPKEKVEAILENSGSLKGQQVELNAKAIYSLNNQVINAGGLIEAEGVAFNAQGEIVLTGAMDQSVLVESQMQADQITITGQEVIIGNQASLTAQGGRIKVGGDWQGQGELATAERVYVADRAKLDVSDATQAGEVVIWSEQQTVYQGHIDASSEQVGGQVEVSSKGHLQFLGEVDLAAEQAGKLLLDPDNITIASQETTNNLADDTTYHFADDAGQDSVISAETLSILLETGEVTLQANDTIQVDQVLDVSNVEAAQGHGLILEANESILVNQSITTHHGDIVLNATNGDIVMADSTRLHAGDGGIELTSVGGNLDLATLTTNETVNLSAGGAVNADSVVADTLNISQALAVGAESAPLKTTVSHLNVMDIHNDFIAPNGVFVEESGLSQIQIKTLGQLHYETAGDVVVDLAQTDSVLNDVIRIQADNLVANNISTNAADIELTANTLNINKITTGSQTADIILNEAEITANNQADSLTAGVLTLNDTQGMAEQTTLYTDVNQIAFTNMSLAEGTHRINEKDALTLTGVDLATSSITAGGNLNLGDGVTGFESNQLTLASGARILGQVTADALTVTQASHIGSNEQPLQVSVDQLSIINGQSAVSLQDAVYIESDGAIELANIQQNQNLTVSASGANALISLGLVDLENNDLTLTATSSIVARGAPTSESLVSANRLTITQVQGVGTDVPLNTDVNEIVFGDGLTAMTTGNIVIEEQSGLSQFSVNTTDGSVDLQTAGDSHLTIQTHNQAVTLTNNGNLAELSFDSLNTGTAALEVNNYQLAGESVNPVINANSITFKQTALGSSGDYLLVDSPSLAFEQTKGESFIKANANVSPFWTISGEFNHGLNLDASGNDLALSHFEQTSGRLTLTNQNDLTLDVVLAEAFVLNTAGNLAISRLEATGQQVVLQAEGDVTGGDGHLITADQLTLQGGASLGSENAPLNLAVNRLNLHTADNQALAVTPYLTSHQDMTLGDIQLASDLVIDGQGHTLTLETLNASGFSVHLSNVNLLQSGDQALQAERLNLIGAGRIGEASDPLLTQINQLDGLNLSEVYLDNNLTLSRVDLTADNSIELTVTGALYLESLVTQGDIVLDVQDQVLDANTQADVINLQADRLWIKQAGGLGSSTNPLTLALDTLDIYANPANPNATLTAPVYLAEQDALTLNQVFIDQQTFNLSSGEALTVSQLKTNGADIELTSAANMQLGQVDAGDGSVTLNVHNSIEMISGLGNLALNAPNLPVTTQFIRANQLTLNNVEFNGNAYGVGSETLPLAIKVNHLDLSGVTGQTNLLNVSADNLIIDYANLNADQTFQSYGDLTLTNLALDNQTIEANVNAIAVGQLELDQVNLGAGRLALASNSQVVMSDVQSLVQAANVSIIKSSQIGRETLPLLVSAGEFNVGGPTQADFVAFNQAYGASGFYTADQGSWVTLQESSIVDMVQNGDVYLSALADVTLQQIDLSANHNDLTLITLNGVNVATQAVNLGQGSANLNLTGRLTNATDDARLIANDLHLTQAKGVGSESEAYRLAVNELAIHQDEQMTSVGATWLQNDRALQLNQINISDDFSLTNNDNLTLRSVEVDADVTLKVAGAILDASDTTSLVANQLLVEQATAIGSEDNPLNLDITTLNIHDQQAQANVGSIWLSEVSDLYLDQVFINDHFDLTVEGNLTSHQVNFGEGQASLTLTGAWQDQGDSSLLVADQLHLIAANSVGTLNNPLNMQVNSMEVHQNGVLNGIGEGYFVEQDALNLPLVLVKDNFYLQAGGDLSVTRLETYGADLNLITTQNGNMSLTEVTTTDYDIGLGGDVSLQVGGDLLVKKLAALGGAGYQSAGDVSLDVEGTVNMLSEGSTVREDFVVLNTPTPPTDFISGKLLTVSANSDDSGYSVGTGSSPVFTDVENVDLTQIQGQSSLLNVSSDIDLILNYGNLTEDQTFQSYGKVIVNTLALDRGVGGVDVDIIAVDNIEIDQVDLGLGTLTMASNGNIVMQQATSQITGQEVVIIKANQVGNAALPLNVLANTTIREGLESDYIAFQSKYAYSDDYYGVLNGTWLTNMADVTFDLTQKSDLSVFAQHDLTLQHIDLSADNNVLVLSSTFDQPIAVTSHQVNLGTGETRWQVNGPVTALNDESLLIAQSWTVANTAGIGTQSLPFSTQLAQLSVTQDKTGLIETATLQPNYLAEQDAIELVSVVTDEAFHLTAQHDLQVTELLTQNQAVSLTSGANLTLSELSTASQENDAVVTLQAEGDIQNSQAIVSGQLAITGAQNVGTDANPLLTQVADFSLSKVLGNVYLSEADDLNLASWNSESNSLTQARLQVAGELTTQQVSALLQNHLYQAERWVLAGDMDLQQGALVAEMNQVSWDGDWSNSARYQLQATESIDIKTEQILSSVNISTEGTLTMTEGATITLAASDATWQAKEHQVNYQVLAQNKGHPSLHYQVNDLELTQTAVLGTEADRLNVLSIASDSLSVSLPVIWSESVDINSQDVTLEQDLHLQTLSDNHLETNTWRNEGRLLSSKSMTLKVEELADIKNSFFVEDQFTLNAPNARTWLRSDLYANQLLLNSSIYLDGANLKLVSDRSQAPLLNEDSLQAEVVNLTSTWNRQGGEIRLEGTIDTPEQQTVLSNLSLYAKASDIVLNADFGKEGEPNRGVDRVAINTLGAVTGEGDKVIRELCYNGVCASSNQASELLSDASATVDTLAVLDLALVDQNALSDLKRLETQALARLSFDNRGVIATNQLSADEKAGQWVANSALLFDYEREVDLFLFIE